MNLDERAQRGAAGIREAVRPVARRDDELFERFERFSERRRERQRIGAGVIAVALAVGAAILLARTFGSLEHRKPAQRPTVPVGTILFGEFNRKTGLHHWYTVGADGSHLVDLHLSTTCAIWFPNGDQILVTNDAAVARGRPLRPAVVSPDGSDLRPLDGTRNSDLNLGCGDVSPDGTRIAIEGFGGAQNRNLNGIYSIRASDGGDLHRLVQGPISPPRYSPDGAELAFIDSSKPGVTPAGAGAVFVMDADGTNLRRLTPWSFAFDIPSWSPDGRWVTFQKPYGQVWVVHPDGTGLHRISIDLPSGVGAGGPSWAPDGRWLVFSLERSSGAEIYRVRPDGTGLQLIASTPGGQDENPDWSLTG